MKYAIEYKERCVMSNINGRPRPVETYRWKEMYLSDDKKALDEIAEEWNKNKSAMVGEFRVVER